MGAIANAWRAASRRQKVTIVGALVIAIAAVASLTAPPNGNQVALVQPTATAPATTPAEFATASASATEEVAETPTFSEVATAVPTPTPTVKPTAKATSHPTPRPTATPGPYGNPWGYDFRPGNLIYKPPSAFCSYFPCIASFWTSTNGYVVQCVDREFSHSGGRQGVCSRHGGYYRTLYSH